MSQFFIYLFLLKTYMSNTPEPLGFVYGRWLIEHRKSNRVLTYWKWRLVSIFENESYIIPEVESCVNIPKVEGREQCLKMSILYRKSNRALTYRKSRGVSNVWKWVAWKEKMTTWTFHVLKAWNSYDLSTVVDESTHRKYDGSTSTVTSRSIRVDSTTSPTHLRSYSRNIL